MKIKNIFLVLILIGSLSCKRNSVVEKLYREEEIIDKMTQSAEFDDYIKTLLINISKISILNESVRGSKNIDTSELLNKSIVLKNEIDNKTLNVLKANPELLKLNTEKVEQLIYKSIDSRLSKNDTKGIQLRNIIESELNNSKTEMLLMQSPDSQELTVDEIWGCIKNAAGIGAASIISVAAIKALAKQGAQKVVITMSSWLLKRAGWFGLGVMIVDLSVCIYSEYND